MDEYLTAVRDVERSTQRGVKWLDTPKPKVDISDLDLTITGKDTRQYLSTMYTLIALALQTDSSRFITYQATPEEASFTDAFPMAVGISESAHKLSHERKNHASTAKYIGFLNEMYYDFLKKLDSIQEGDSTLLDNTICLYGCTTSVTHRAVNFPMTLSGGKNMGFKHGQHHAFKDEAFANVFVTIGNQMGVPMDTFADSTGDFGTLV
jgi:hypothetical protein